MSKTHRHLCKGIEKYIRHEVFSHRVCPCVAELTL